jgi:hypothetical protein
LHPCGAALCAAAVLLVNVLLVSTAAADFTAPALLSAGQLSDTPPLQFEQASAPALSANGRYAVFRGVLADIPGIYRRELPNGPVELVAGGDLASPGEPCNSAKDPLAACDATAPSISENGQYIAFTTTADLQAEGGGGKPQGEPASDRGCPEVYVRNMGPPGEPLPASAPDAYTLASALNETDTGIGFAPCPASAGFSTASHQPGFAVAGAQAAAAVAISADGRHVVFTVLSASNMTRGPGCAAQTPLAQCPPETPPSQVAVRDLETDTTTLVSATPAGQPTPGGGAFPSSESESAAIDIPKFAEYSDQLIGSTAAISADASTVAWLGTNVPAQVPSATDVIEQGIGGPTAPSREAEPLWRRVADGPAAVTKRLLAGAGLDFYFRPAAGEPNSLVYPVDDGSLLGIPGSAFIPPALSEDGRTVALIANAPSPASEGSWAFASLPWADTDAYVVRIPEGSEEPQASALTATPDFAAGVRAIASVKDIAISPRGDRVAFDTGRSQFDLPTLAFAGPPLINLSYQPETFEADLENGTLQQVTATYNDSEPNGGTGLLAFAREGQLAFESSATNLFYGDGVPAPEVYLVQEVSPGPSAAPQEVSLAPALPAPEAAWTLSATAFGQADGNVLVQAQVPGAGHLSAVASAQLPAPTKGGAKPSRRARRRVARSSKARHAGGAAVTVPLRTVAQAAAGTTAPSLTQLRLRVSARYSSLIEQRLGLYAVVRVTFTAPGHPPLVREIPVTFHRAPPRKQHRAGVRRRSAARAQHRRITRPGDVAGR